MIEGWLRRDFEPICRIPELYLEGIESWPDDVVVVGPFKDAPCQAKDWEVTVNAEQVVVARFVQEE